MPEARPTYDLVLLLDPQAADDVRAKALAEVRAQIEARGELVLEQSWGMRALAYPIEHRDQADYQLLQLHGDGPLIAELERSLRIAEGVLRHRIIKLAPGTPPPPEHGPRAAEHAQRAPSATAAAAPAAYDDATAAVAAPAPAAEDEAVATA